MANTVTGSTRPRMGRRPSAADIVNWTATPATTAACAGLGLMAGQTYWMSVQAQNAAGLWSLIATDPFVAGQKKIVSIYLPVILR